MRFGKYDIRAISKFLISRYVWLPIEWEGDQPVIRWYDEWKVEDFK